MINKYEAELIGAHAGDGTLYKTNSNSLVWELRGSPKEKDYYLDHIVPLLQEIFNKTFKTKYRAGGSYGIQTCDKDIINFLLSNEFKPGSKTYSVEVPYYILKSKKEIKLSFLRGLFDTDGCLYIEKGYPKLEFGFASKPLRDTLADLLKSLDFRFSIWESKSRRKGTPCIAYKLRISGKESLFRWFKEVSPGNPKHLNKYEKYLTTMPRSHNLVLRRL